jgi:hypothetical protein
MIFTRAFLPVGRGAPSRFLDLKMFHNDASSDMYLFLRDDKKDLRTFLLKRLLLFIVTMVRRKD